MADISAFPTIHTVVTHESLIRTYTFTEAASAGMAVGFAATGVSNAVVPMDATADEQPIGVAVYDVAIGEKGAVAMNGNVCVVANADDTTAIDAGDQVELNDNAVQGTVSALALTQFTANHYVLGIALEDIAGAGTGEILVAVGVQVDSTT